MTSSTNPFSGPGPRFFSIPPGRAFLEDLAEGVVDACRKNDFQIPDVTIYLPTRRAMRALGDAFLKASHARAVLPPRIRALGDIDEDELVLFEGAAEDEAALSPAVPPAQRRLMLARLVTERERTYFEGQRRWPGAIAAADELGKLLDSLYTEEIKPTKLHDIVPDGLAHHWKESLEFLSIIVTEWPSILKEQGLMDPAARRIALIGLQAQRWKEHPPRKPVIIAGTTGSTPAVARMMKVVAGLPAGAVVLPGLDLEAPDSVWDAVDEPHPQSGLKALIQSLEIGRRDVRIWPASGTVKHNSRTDLISVALRPAGASDGWRDWAADARAAKTSISEAVEGLSLIEARDEECEASIIALKLRETLEASGRTGMLVTPDRDLSRRVALKMRRWGVTVDDSAGAPFANTLCGGFLRLTAQWLNDASDPVKVMALIDHPIFGGGMAPSVFQKARSFFDRGLRGLRPASTIAGLRRKLENQQVLPEFAAELLESLERAAAMWPGKDSSFSGRVHAHLAVAEQLSSVDDEKGEVRLWRGEDGEAGASALPQLMESLSLIAYDRPEEYADIFTRLIAGVMVRRRSPAHPRITILGPLEARLQTADVVVLGGLNESVWPRDAAIDPFLSRPMRRELGLPSPERRIGLAAHDFMQMTSMGEVMLTRSTRAGGKPTKPSRWIVRLKNILKGADALEKVDDTSRWESLSDLLDQPEKVLQIAAPAPRPPVDARPKRYSVTQIEKLLRDPYAVYARHILRLDPLDPLGEDFSSRYLGNLLHKVLEVYFREAGDNSEVEESVEHLSQIFERHAQDYGLDETHFCFLKRRLEEAFQQIIDWDVKRQRLGCPAVIEGKGVWTFPLNSLEFTLSARADRIDQIRDGGAYIIDYKSGEPPSLDQQKAMFSPQLPLTGLIVEQGGFEEIGAASVSGFEFLRLIGGKKDSEKSSGFTGEDASALIGDTRDGLFSILRHFADPSTSFPSQPRPQYANRFGDFDHLARRRERQAQGGDE
ncbi:double-strand break repair protein AddB [Hyphococcus flavus]|uniref:Double-strand break repair protein AddB n=1 Tax=Hyphococcus flavus TaxID=1866326 RepID=A0AAE9ZK23_9PROT|nr:double-strand break repair protein AddB [Hyphococcus flavus]WDI32586.1 double-strand break repair protein AddB [Hyphococcus flavus]